MSYMSPPESRSRVENIKKKFEATNNDVSTSNNEKTNFTKLSANKNTLGSKAQSSNGYKNVSSKKKVLQANSSTPNDFPKKFTYTSPTIKPQNLSATIKAEQQVSSPSGRGGHIRRSPAFRCDKIVKGRNVTGQTSGIRERPRSILDNRVKLFEDVESVKSVVKRLNTSSPSSGDPIEKTSKPPLQKQVELPEEQTATNSGKIVSVSHVNIVQSGFGSVVNKTVRDSISDHEKSSTVVRDTGSVELTPSSTQNTSSKISLQTPSSPIVPSQAPISSFLHKYEQDKIKLPLQIKRNVINRALEKSKVLNNTNVDSYAKVNSSKIRTEVNGVKCKNGDVPPGASNSKENSGNRNVTLTDCLKAALKSPLPPGPPPKKPPRTFAHNISAKSPSPQNVPSATTSAMDVGSSKDTHRHVKFTKSASADIANIEKTGKPVRSKTESEIKLKKLESVLLKHQQGSGGIALNPKSPMANRTIEDKATATYDEPEIIHAKSAGGRVGPLPSLPSENELLKSTKSTNSDNGGRFGGCINLNCVSTNSNNPLYSQIHFYEKVAEKQSEFFISVPNKQSVSQGSTRPYRYGTLLRSRSRSEEHIYAEPFEFLNKNKNHKRALQHRRSPGNGIKSGESVGDLTKVGTSLEELQKVTTSSSKTGNATAKNPVLHYLCTPINPENTTGTTENQTKPKVSESIIKELITPIMGRRASEPQNLGSDSEEKKKPSILRFTGLVRSGQSNNAVEGTANKVDRTKVQLLMNQAFGTPLQGLPTSPLELAGSDSDSMASTPDDGGFVMIFPDTTTGSTQLTDGSKAASKCIDASGDGEDSSSTNSVEQQEQLTRLSEERKVYVRRVSSRMYHRVRSTATTPSAFPHLFQCILLVGLNLDSGEKKIKVPYIKTKYPLDADVPPHIEHLCFPDAKDWPPPEPATPPVPGPGGIDEQSYSLVITSETGERRFGYCRRVLPEGSNLCLPLAYCIISPFRASGFYYKILAELESRHGQPEWLQTAFIKELYSCQFPGPGQGLRLSTTNTTYNIAGPVCSMVTTVVRRPLDSRLEERDLTQLFSALPVPALLQLFGSLLLERKVILISNSLSRLSSCVEALQSILYPFSWQHTLIPVLPTSLLDICLSPTPYIVGILRGRDASTVPGPIDESLMVDLDESRILQCVGDEATILPQRIRRCLKVALQLVTNTTQPRDASRNVLVSEAFVRMFVEVCGHYRNHIVTQQDGMKVFERESFIKAVNSQSIRLFLEWFTETAMFSSFIESHLEIDSDVRGMFDQRCLEHSEEMENNTRLFLRNYKALNKKVKTFGDRLKDWTPFS